MAISDQPFYVQALIPTGEPRWNANDPVGTPVEVTYSFMTQVPDYYPSDAGVRNRFIAFNTDQIIAARAALAFWQGVSGLTFREVSDAGDGGQICFGTTNTFVSPTVGSPAFSSYPGSDARGDVWLNNTHTDNLFQALGSWGFQTLLHEIGHALGLEHPADYDPQNGGIALPHLPADQESQQYTVMSYNLPAEYGGWHPQTPMLYDIAAIQYLYGVNEQSGAAQGGDPATANSYYRFPGTNTIATIWDAGVNDNDTLSAEDQRQFKSEVHHCLLC